MRHLYYAIQVTRHVIQAKAHNFKRENPVGITQITCLLISDKTSSQGTLYFSLRSYDLGSYAIYTPIVI
jgi:hypothetical protein